MKTKKTKWDKRGTYTFNFNDGTSVTLRPGEDGVTEADIKILHSLDDAEVYNNLKNSRPPLTAAEKAEKKRWEAEHPGERYPANWNLSFDYMSGEDAIGLAIATEEYGSKFFANGAAPSGVLEHPGTIKDPQRVRDSWMSQFGGSANSNKIAVLEEGLKYTPISISPEQAQFLETRKFQINEIARIFRVPPHMVGDLEKSSFSNIEQQSLEFVKYTLDPWVVRWEQSIQRTLLSSEEKKTYFVKFNVEGLLRGDYQSRMNGYATARQNGWMSANDIRELENLDRITTEDGGDLYLVNGNMLPLNKAGAFADTTTDEGKEEEANESDEEVLGVEEPGGRRRNRGKGA